MAKANNKTVQNSGDVDAFLAGVENPVRRADAIALKAMMDEIAGQAPALWGDSIVGYGKVPLTYASGRELDWFIMGFSPRKANLTLYISQGFDGSEDLLNALGKYKTSKACLYINRLSDVDETALRALICATWAGQKASC